MNLFRRLAQLFWKPTDVIYSVTDAVCVTLMLNS